ncbi:Uncharacterised protein [Mycobacteroides abscessus subsp. abscessus]|nr:Uncharacterised protein [Mycobacteroides abscessus subsp. abscessus]
MVARVIRLHEGIRRGNQVCSIHVGLNTPLVDDPMTSEPMTAQAEARRRPGQSS